MKTGLTTAVTSEAIGTFITISQPMKENVTWTFQNLAFFVTVLAALVTICYTIHKWRKEEREYEEEHKRKTIKRRSSKRSTKTTIDDQNTF